jgi:hypothetical protein
MRSLFDSTLGNEFFVHGTNIPACRMRKAVCLGIN